MIWPSTGSASFAAPASTRVVARLVPDFGQSGGHFFSPNGSLKLTGSPPANPYRLSPPAKPMGSSCVNRPLVGS